jgi:hypothetical protein
MDQARNQAHRTTRRYIAQDDDIIIIVIIVIVKQLHLMITGRTEGQPKLITT